MGTNHLPIEIKTIETAPHYRNDCPEFKEAIITKAIVIEKGTKGNNPTVDIWFENEHGQKYIAMITGDLMIGLARVIEGVKARSGN
jgi:hypothetical protein